MKSDGVWALSGLGVAGQVLVALLLLIGLLALLGNRGPLATLRRWLWGYELWAAFVVAAVATGGSLYYSQVMGFIPCELCWFQRICMYPLSIILLLMAIWGDNRSARYLLALPVVGAGVSIFHMLVGYKVITEPAACTVGVPTGCGLNWIFREDFGYLQIETLAFTAFLLLIGFLSLQPQGPPTTRLRFLPMPSGKRAKQQRRVAVPPPPKGAAGLGARRASPMVLAIAGGVVVIIVLAVVLAIVLTNGSSSGGTHTGNGLGDGPTITLATGTPAVGSSTGPNAFADAPDVAKLFNGIPQKGFVLGDANAPVTLVEYIDLQCPVCQSFETTELKQLVDKYVKPGNMKIQLYAWNIIDANYPGDDDSLRGQKAVTAAAQQGKAFQFAENLYNHQPEGGEGTGWMNDAMISNVAASVDGLKTGPFVTTANSPATQQQVTAFDAAGNRLSQEVLAAGQSPGTPTLLLAKGSGKPKLYGVGYPTLTNLEAAIDALLK